MPTASKAHIASQIGLWAGMVVVGIFIYLLWTATHNNGDNTTKNLPGSIDNHKEFNYYPLSFGLQGCEYLRGVDGAQVRNDKNNTTHTSDKR